MPCHVPPCGVVPLVCDVLLYVAPTMCRVASSVRQCTHISAQEPYLFPLVVKKPRGTGVQQVEHPCILPHEFLHTFHAHGGDLFAESFLGGGDSVLEDLACANMCV
jgi:hypothetical protein